MQAVRLNKALILAIYIVSVIYVEQVLAQSGDVAPPLNPPDAAWPTPPGGTSLPPGAVPPPPLPGMDGAPPIAPPGFEGFDFGSGSMDDFGDDGGFGGRGSGGSGSGREGKDSFKVVSPGMNNNSCDQWGHELLGSKTYEDYGSCSFALEKKIDQARADIDEVYDRFERQKLKTVIRGQMTRKDAEVYKFDFTAFRDKLNTAARSGCSCKK